MRVHGTVSPLLIRNLMEFPSLLVRHGSQKVLHELRSTLKLRKKPTMTLTQISLFAPSPAGWTAPLLSIAMLQASRGRLKRNIGAGLFVHGFDIPLSDEESYKRAFRTNQDTLKSLGHSTVFAAIQPQRTVSGLE